MSPPCPTLNQEESFDKFCQSIMLQNQSVQMQLDRMTGEIKRIKEDQLLGYSSSNSTDQIPDIDYDQSIIPQDHNTQISLDLEDEGVMERSYQETLNENLRNLRGLRNLLKKK